MSWIRDKRKILVWMALVVLCLVGTAGVAFGELATTTITKATAGVSKVTLTWKQVPEASGYYIYKEKASGALKKIATVKDGKKTSAVITKLKNGTTYTFRVAAYDGTQTGEPSEAKSATPSIGDPGKLNEVRVLKIASKKVYLRWSKNTKASGYQIFMYKESSGEYELVKEISNPATNSAAISNLKNGKTYYFKVRAFLKKGNSYGYGAMSAALVGRPLSKASLKAAAAVRPYYYKATMNYKVEDIPANASITVTELGKSKSKVTYDGESYKIPTASFTTTALITKGKKPYKTKVAEKFVNSRGYASETEYLIWISTYTQHLYVFQGSQYNWKCIRHTPCATGKLDTPTPLGISQVYSKRDVVLFAYGPDWVQGGFWGLRIAGGFVHSWLYNITKLVDIKIIDEERAEITRVKKPVEEVIFGTNQDAWLWMRESFGTPTSRGCVRVTISFAKWMYDTIPVDTTNVTY